MTDEAITRPMSWTISVVVGTLGGVADDAGFGTGSLTRRLLGSRSRGESLRQKECVSDQREVNKKKTCLGRTWGEFAFLGGRGLTSRRLKKGEEVSDE
jgi:hypothetical protein